MSRYTQRRGVGSLVRKRWMAVPAIGVLAVVAVATLQSQSSDAASKRNVQLAAGRNSQTAAAPTDQAGNGQNQNNQQNGQQDGQNQNNNQNQQNNNQNNNQNQNTPQNGNGEPLPASGTDPAGTDPAKIVNPTSTENPVGQQRNDGNKAPALGILGNTCDNSKLTIHDGFQNGNRCVTTEFGEVASENNNPSLLIASAPRVVRANQAFDLRVSSRNLVRDRFLAAAQGGYYRESSFLNGQGLTRGHFHTACRMLQSQNTAPDPAPAPAFFVATEDKKGGRQPDTVTVRVSGLPRGLAQCAVWAGDGSHRIPMMQRANQTPAFDVVRIQVR